MPHDFHQHNWDEAVESACRRLVRLALEEDLAGGRDITTEATVPAGAAGAAQIVARTAGVVAGVPALLAAVEEFGHGLRCTAEAEDGQTCAVGRVVATLGGNTADILTAERTLLNLLGRLMGVATLTRQYVDAVAGTTARIYDTRKTTPGWRLLEKYAVRCGGGCNHRTGLFDAVLIKDNHLAQGELPAAALRKARNLAAAKGLPIEIEVDTLAQLRDVLPENPDIVLLDNMTPELLSEAVALRDRHAPGVVLEASGGVNFETVRRIAETGVDRISVGGLTHSAVSLDVGLDWLGTS